MKLSLLLFIPVLFGCTPHTSNLPDPHEAGWKGEKVCEIIFENDKQRVLKCTFPPGVGHEKHHHAPHFGYTIQGSKFRIEDERGVRDVDVPTGYHYSNEEIIEHTVLNIGDSTAVFLIVETK